MKELVSIIIPVYNAEKYLAEAIRSIQSQKYDNWELLLINDCSPDNSKKAIEELIKKDTRITWVDLTKNSGAAIARNKGIEISKGRFICFLDSDDIWNKDKLSAQVNRMKKNGWAFSYTGYEFTNENGLPNGKKVNVPESLSYKQALKNTSIWTSTVMLDTNQLSKSDIYMPNLRRGQDTATWWKILKKIDKAYGINQTLAYYRRHSNTLSSNKLKALRRTWQLYRRTEKLPIHKSIYYFVFYLFNTIKKRV